MHITFISLYDTGAAGLRSLSSFLMSRGHQVSLIFYGEMGRTHKEFHQFSKIELSQNVPRWCNDQDKQELIQRLRALNPELIGISLRSAFLQTAIELTKDIKKHFPAPILWGGIHPTICPEESILHADLICQGEGEYAMLDLVRALEQGKEITTISNFWVKEKGEIIKNDLRPLNDLDLLPFADFTEGNKYYIYSRPFHANMYPIMTSRGCPFSCTFCCNSILREIYRGKGNYIRRRSVDNVLSELLIAKESYAISEVLFLDDIFVDDPKWLSPFLEEYKRKINLPFACYLHSRFVKEPLIRSLKEAGLHSAALGIQSGSERIRREVYHRRQSNEEILRSADILNREIVMAYDIIIDNPFETREDLVETINLLLKFPHPFRVHLLTLTFFPGYPITIRALEKRLISRDNADISAEEWLMVYKDQRPKEIQSLYLLMAATQHASVPRDFISESVRNKRLLENPKKLFDRLDGMITEKDYIHDYRKGERIFEYLEEIRKVLVIPSGDIASVSTVLGTVWEKFPGCLCSILTGEFSQKYCTILSPEKIAPLARMERASLELIVHAENDHRFNVAGLEYGWIRQLRKKEFDLTILLHENEEGLGYIHVELLALLIGAKHTLIVKPDQSLVRLDPVSFIKGVARRKIGRPGSHCSG